VGDVVASVDSVEDAGGAVRKRPMLRAEVLETIYAGLSVPWELLFRVPGSQAEFETVFMTSKLWRMNNLYSIVDKDGDVVLFTMNYAQHIVYAESLKWYRLLILKSRQQGISTFWLLCFEDDVIFEDNISAGLMAQGKTEASKLLRRAKLGWRSLDEGVKRFLGGVRIVVDNKDEIGLSNDSSLYIKCPSALQLCTGCTYLN